MTAEKIRNFPSSIRAISRLGVGLDSIDLVAAAELKMPVIFQPTYAFNEVANHALAMIMSLARGLPQGDASTKKGEWTPAPKIARITSLQDTTLGVIGCGRIGRSLIEKARPIFKNIVGFDPGVTGDIPGCTMVKTKEELIEQSEIISLHAPYLPSTHHIIGAREINMMPKNGIIVNVSRGGLIDEAALNDALINGVLDGAGLDVFENEPLAEDSPLRKAPNIILTPHIAWYSQSAGPRLMEWGISDVCNFINGSKELNGKFAVGPF
jgi:D-3-phosphoglycerate dehydrogenase